MIKLVNGTEVDYNEDFDKFFHDLLKAIISESKKSAKLKKEISKESATEREILLQEIMDNCIYVTHQLFTLYKDNEKLTQFIITGFIFNSVILAALPAEDASSSSDDEAGTVH